MIPQQETDLTHLNPRRRPTRSLKIRNSTYTVRRSTQVVGGEWQYFSIQYEERPLFYKLLKLPCYHLDGLVVIDNNIFKVTARDIARRKVWKSKILDTNKLKEMVDVLYQTKLPSAKYPDQSGIGGDLEVEDQLIDLACKEQEQALQYLHGAKE